MPPSWGCQGRNEWFMAGCKHSCMTKYPDNLGAPRVASKPSCLKVDQMLFCHSLDDTISQANLIPKAIGRALGWDSLALYARTNVFESGSRHDQD
jgi:hypothetical protein